MWLFLPFGFFSITADPDTPNRLQVRARVKEDLDNLRNAYLPELTPTVHLEGHDYPFRGYAPTSDVARAMEAITRGIYYTNFKDQVELVQGRERHMLYLAVWRIMEKFGRMMFGKSIPLAYEKWPEKYTRMDR